MQDYKYEQLPTADKKYAIRLLDVHPANALEEPIICSLSQASLTSSPVYSALSYACGKGQLDKIITCNGFRLAITSHLDMALRRFRASKQRTIWIDAICISQSNIVERNHQVTIMGNIYKQARQVFVYLGESSRDDDFTAIALAKKLTVMSSWMDHYGSEEALSQATLPPAESVMQRQTINLWRLKKAGFPDGKKSNLRFCGLPAFSDTAWIALRLLYARNWFQRTWIIQEAVFCPKVTVYLGCHSIDWKFLPEIGGFVNSLELQSIVPAPEESALDCLAGEETTLLIDYLRKIHSANTSIDLLQLLTVTRTSFTTDPKDKIFALLGLANNDMDAPRPEYGKPVETVYIDFATYFVSKGQGSELLQDPALGFGTMDIPSWVPDWTSSASRVPRWNHRHFKTAGMTKGNVRNGEPSNILIIEGTLLDEIEYLGPEAPPELVGEGESYYCGDAWDLWDLETRAMIFGEQTEVDQSLLDRYARTLLADNEITSNPSFSPSDEYLKMIRRESDDFKGLARYSVHMTRFCVTNRGRMALVPRHSKLQDRVSVILGVSTPLLLRNAQEGHYSIVGRAYVEGIMYGQAVNVENFTPQDITIQ